MANSINKIDDNKYLACDIAERCAPILVFVSIFILLLFICYPALQILNVVGIVSLGAVCFMAVRTYYPNVHIDSSVMTACKANPHLNKCFSI